MDQRVEESCGPSSKNLSGTQYLVVFTWRRTGFDCQLCMNWRAHLLGQLGQAGGRCFAQARLGFANSHQKEGPRNSFRGWRPPPPPDTKIKHPSSLACLYAAQVRKLASARMDEESRGKFSISFPLMRGCWAPVHAACAARMYSFAKSL